MSAKYSQARAADDCADLMKALGIDKAHLCGLSMGATAGAGVRHPPSRQGDGAGDRRGRRRRRTDPEAKKRFKEECEAFAQRIEKEGMPAMAELYCTSSARNTYRYKDPRGWAEFKQQFADGSADGHAMTMRGVQGSRVPFFERTEELKKIAEPMLVVIGDEDDSTHSLAVHLKQHVPRSRRARAAEVRPHHEPRGAGRLQHGRAGLPARRRERPLAGPRGRRATR